MKWLPLSFKPILFLYFSSFFLNANSQTLPSFTIHETNGTIINSRSLIKNKPIVLIYFSPDCEHCTTLLRNVFSNIAQFKKATIVLVSFLPIADVAAFEKNYHTSQYKNIIVCISVLSFIWKFPVPCVTDTGIGDNKADTSLFWLNEKVLISISV